MTANGAELRFTRFQVIQNGHDAADSFQVELPRNDPQAPHDAKWWSEQTEVEVEISVGFADDDGKVGKWTSLIIGPVDAIADAPISFGTHSGGSTGSARANVGRGGMVAHEGGPAHPMGGVLTIRGRDYSGQLIASGVSAEYVSGKLTSADVVKKIAEKVPQLKVDLSEASDSVGDPVSSVEGRLFLKRSAWDVITSIAEHDGMRAIVRGKTLKIAPGPSSDDGAFELFFRPPVPASGNAEFKPSSGNVITLRMARNLMIAKGVDHFVQAYDSKTGKKPSRAVAKSRGAKSASTPMTYSDNIPGMTKAQTKKHAKSRADRNSKFERDIEFQIPGDAALTIDRMVRLSGTGTAYDQDYEMDQLTHFFGVTEGYRMEGRAKNRSPDVKIEVSEQ